MEIVKCYFVFFIAVISIPCSETIAYGPKRIRNEFKAVRNDMSIIREDITSLFDKMNQLNISAVEGCGLCVSDNKTSCAPVMDHDGRHDMNMNINNMLIKYHSLIKAFASEKRINRELISASERLAFDRDRDLESRLKLMEDIISESNKVANERDRQVQDQLRAMRESIEDLHKNMTSFMTMIITVPIVNTNCTTVPESGVYTFYLELIMSNVTVYCDQDTDRGGWMVLMRRQDGSVNFTRPWVDYKIGFGGPGGEFWAGNELLHKLTKARPLQLRIDMEDFDGNTAFATYEEFQVGAEKDKYRLHVLGYSGTAGDSLIDTISVFAKHAGMQFSTFDSDNDKWRYTCTKSYKGGWWYNGCGGARLTAVYSHDKMIIGLKGIVWYSWKGWYEALKRVEMKIR